MFGEGAEILNSKLTVKDPKFRALYNVLSLKDVGFGLSDMPQIFGETAFIKERVLYFYAEDVAIPDVLTNGWLAYLCVLFGCNQCQELKKREERAKTTQE